MTGAPSITSPHLDRFRRGIARNAAGWLAFVGQGPDIPTLDRELPNLTRAVSQALLEPSAGEAGIALALALWPVIEWRGHWIGWPEVLERAQVVCESLHRPVDRAALLDQRGELARIVGDFSLARERQEEALAIYRQLEDLSRVCRVLNHLSQQYMALGDYQAAEQCSQESAAISERLGDLHQLAVAHNNWGIICLETRRLEAALQHYTEAAALFERLGDRRLHAKAINNLGNVYRRMQDRERARACYAQTASVLQELGDEIGAARIRVNVGIILHEQGQTAEALALHLELEPVFRRVSDRPWLARVAHNQGVFFAALGRQEDSARAFAEAAELHLTNGDRVHAAQSVLCWAELLLNHAEVNAARQHLCRAEELLQTLPAPPLWLSREYEALSGRAAALAQPG